MSFSSVSDGSGTPARWSLRLRAHSNLLPCQLADAIRSLGKKERALLAYLALSPTGGVKQRKQIGRFSLGRYGQRDRPWIVCAPASGGLRKSFGRRRASHAGFARRQDIVLDVAAFQIDARIFRSLVGDVRGKRTSSRRRIYARAIFSMASDVNSEENSKAGGVRKIDPAFAMKG
jgi:hypothetical protein